MLGWYKAYHKWFSKPDCEKLIELGKQFKPQDGRIFEGEKTSNNKQVVNRSIRVSTVRWLPKSDSRCFLIYNTIKHIFEDANASTFGFDLSYLNEIQFTEYPANKGGKYDWHKDLLWLENGTKVQRKLSMTISLSKKPDFKGGRLEFVAEGEKLHVPERFYDVGTVIVFPSFLNHRVSEVTQGTRYSLVSWYYGPHFR